MRIEKGSLCIRDATAGDASQLAAWWNDGSVMAHAGFPYGLGISEEEIIESLAKDSDDTRRRLIIEYDDKKIGEMNFSSHGDHAQIGIKICERDYQEKGLGRICLSMLIRELFDKGYEKIALDTNLNNTRAQHVYELLGFRKMRVNIDSWKDQTGKLNSSVDYELIEEDFHDYAKGEEL